eukprot:9341693-Alexandrium_andersonii.AAC.1
MAACLRDLADYVGALMAETAHADMHILVPLAGALGEVLHLAEVLRGVIEAPVLDEAAHRAAAPVAMGRGARRDSLRAQPVRVQRVGVAAWATRGA